MVASKKIKVLQLGSPSGLYGAERWILSLVKYLDPELVESHIGSIADETASDVPLCLEASKLGYPTHVIESSGRFSLSSVRKLRGAIEYHRFDILHTHGYKTDLIGRLATAGTACRIVSTPHGWTQEPGVKLWLYEAMDRMVFPFLDAVAPLSEGILNPLRRVPGLEKKLHLIINGVDIGEIDEATDIASEIALLKQKEAFVIGYIGRLVHGKALDVMLSAVAQYGEPRWEVAIIGEGEQSTELEKLARSQGLEDRVHFYGFRPDRLSFLKGFDAFVLPSRSEGIPRCLMEAMAAGVPVIASNIPGCRKLVDGKSTGLLFELDDGQDLARSIKSLASDHAMRDRFVESGRKFVMANYSAARMAKQYEELFTRLVKNPGA